MTTTAIPVEFGAPMPGLAPHTSFTLEAIPGAHGLSALRAVDADVRLFLVDGRVADAGYRPRLPDSALADIGAAGDDAVRVLVVANPGDEGVHVNLRAPILVHDTTGRAVQVILEDQTYPIRALLGGLGER